MRKTVPNVLVRTRKCAISRKNSSECFLGWSGNFSASESPKISTVVATNSTAWPFAGEGCRFPVIARQAPVVMRLSILYYTEISAIKACKMCIVEPSFK